MYVEGDVPYMNGNCNNNNGFGNGWEGLIGLALVAGLFDGGFGFGGGRGGNNGALTRSDLCQDMNFSDLEGAVRGVSQGICDSTFALNNTITNGFAGVQSALCQGFYGTQTGIMQSGYDTRNAINGVSSQLASCCCDIKSILLENRYLNAQQTCDITNAIQAGTSQVLGFLTQEKISALQSENALLTSQLSQNAQTQTIINTLRPVASPAYITCSPYESAYGFYGNRNGYGNNCGCGCGCGCNG